MFSGTSTPSSASTTRPKKVQLVKLMPCAALGFQVVRSHGLTTAWCPLARYTTAAANIARMARPYSANTMLTRFWVTRNRSMATRADAAISPMIAAPCHWIGQLLTAGKA